MPDKSRDIIRLRHLLRTGTKFFKVSGSGVLNEAIEYDRSEDGMWVRPFIANRDSRKHKVLWAGEIWVVPVFTKNGE